MKAVTGKILRLKEKSKRQEVSNLLSQSLEFFEEGAIVFDELSGTILEVGDRLSLLKKYPTVKIIDYSDCLILPSFIDTHSHMPQTDMLGCQGEELLGWLYQYTFPNEEKLAKDLMYAKDLAKIYIEELFSHGISTAVSFASHDGAALDIFFEMAQMLNLRVAAGPSLMDQGIPESLSIKNLDKLFMVLESQIKKWHQKNESLFYALTPRFALSCSEKLLSVVKSLKAAFPNIIVQTHFAENKTEIAETKKHFSSYLDYLDIYDKTIGLHEKMILAHAIHVNDRELTRLGQTKATIAHCPSSNLFLGSGLFKMSSFIERGIPVTLGCDVGAGTSFSMWRQMSLAYGIQKLQGVTLSAADLLFLATAAAEHLFDYKIGRIQTGYFADFQVLDLCKNTLLKRRFETFDKIENVLEGLIHLDDKNILKCLYAKGRVIFEKL